MMMRALQDMFMDLMKEDDDKGNKMFRTQMHMDDEMAQEALSKMKQPFAENGKKSGAQKLSFEAVEQWTREKTETQLNRRSRHKKRHIRSKRKQCKRRNGGNMK